MDDNILLAIAKLFRAQQEQILNLRRELAALRKFVGEDSGSAHLESLVTLAEDEHKWEQVDAAIKLLELGKDPKRDDG